MPVRAIHDGAESRSLVRLASRLLRGSQNTISRSSCYLLGIATFHPTISPALTGRSLPALQARLEILYRQPNGYINRPHQQRANADANATRLIYELDDKGADELRARGLTYSRKKNLRNFAHELMACTIAASFEIGATGNSALRISALAATRRQSANARRYEAADQSARAHV